MAMDPLILESVQAMELLISGSVQATATVTPLTRNRTPTVNPKRKFSKGQSVEMSVDKKYNFG